MRERKGFVRGFIAFHAWQTLVFALVNKHGHKNGILSDRRASTFIEEAKRLAGGEGGEVRFLKG